jgi:hypothetical protein
MSADSEGAAVNITAGDPLLIPANEPITLCARSDLDPNRFYAGAIANLGIYNTQLTAAQVATIYRQVQLAADMAEFRCHNVSCCTWPLRLLSI